MKAHYRSRHSFVRSFSAAALSLAASVASVSAAFVIDSATDFFEPSFRGGTTSTYFGWSTETIGVGGNTVNGTPSINPAALTGSSFLAQAGTNDVISGTNNVYSSVAGINSAQITLTIPTAGVVGVDGFTTIIIQGTGFGGFGFPLDAFTFGTIDGISATYLYAANSAAGNPGQWWAKWEVPGNEENYSVDVLGYDAGAGVLSVTGMVVDTYYSETAFAPDVAVVPEPSSALLGISALGSLVFMRRRNG